MKSALFVDTSRNFSIHVSEALGSMFSVSVVTNFSEATATAKRAGFDLIIVDGENLRPTLAFGAELRQVSQMARTPLIFLAAGRSSEELVQAFAAGFDDYLAFPFESIEIKARIEARLKTSMPLPAHEYFWRGELRFAVGKQRVILTNADGERDLELTPNEFRILYYLASNEKKTLSRDQILKEVWGERLHVVDRTVDKHVCSLRRKLGDKANYVISVPMKGYAFDVSKGTNTGVTQGATQDPGQDLAVAR